MPGRDWVLATAVTPAGPALAATGSDLALAAWTGPPDSGPPLAGPPGCLLDGQIYNLETIARRADVPAGAAPKAILAAADERLGEGYLGPL